MAKKDKIQARLRRKKSIRKRIAGTTERPRLSVYRSNKHIYAQVINDDESRSLLAVSDLSKGVEAGGQPAGDGEEGAELSGKMAQAAAVGAAIAKACIDKGITKVVFDRNGYLYHGRVRALADAARKAGLEF